mgnify:CR=1 FL=1
MENSFITQVNESMKYISTKEQMLGKGLNIPNNAINNKVRWRLRKRNIHHESHQKDAHER